MVDGSDSNTIDVTNVVKSYRSGLGEVRALRGLTCQIPRGKLSFIVGPSGSGKSSLLYLLGGLDQPDSGEIAVFGRRLSSLSKRERDEFRRRQVGFIFQNFNLLGNLSAVDNVLVPFLPQGISAKLRQEAVDLLTQVGLGNRLDHRPNQLSGGEQQRVAIARALLKRPLLVLGDEPTGELDSNSGAEIYRHLRELRDAQGSTVVVVTHDRSHIQPGDFVLTIRDGGLEVGNG
ncbi:MAG: ABC transporter ATP-binding protein [Planctomycetota bacterium]|nr:ABC transporter ATP-binding protein [Planctomycetota bacterium]